MLTEQIICGDGVIRTKLDIAIQRIKTFEPPEGYFVAFSGGKDSQCIYHLCKEAGVKFDAHYSVTSVDPPELIYFIREHYPDVSFDIPHDSNGKRISMWSLITEKKMPPTRMKRYCCKELKESSGKGRITVTGVRWAESVKRARNHDVVDIIQKPRETAQKAEKAGVKYRKPHKDSLILNDDNDASRRLVEQCYRTQKTMLNPIIDWAESEVWEYLNEIVKVPHCSLYDIGYKRIGCIGCPMSGKKQMERAFERYPKYKQIYTKAFEKMIAERIKAGMPTSWKSAEDVFNWWMGGA